MYRNLRRFVVGSIAFFSRRTARAISQHAQHFNYDEDLAKLSTIYSSAAYDRNPAVGNWSFVNPVCNDRTKGFILNETYVGEGTEAFAYVGVDHTEKRIVVSFKGTSDLRDWMTDLRSWVRYTKRCAPSGTTPPRPPPSGAKPTRALASPLREQGTNSVFGFDFGSVFGFISDSIAEANSVARAGASADVDADSEMRLDADVHMVKVNENSDEKSVADLQVDSGLVLDFDSVLDTDSDSYVGSDSYWEDLKSDLDSESGLIANVNPHAPPDGKMGEREVGINTGKRPKQGARGEVGEQEVRWGGGQEREWIAGGGGERMGGIGEAQDELIGNVHFGFCEYYQSVVREGLADRTALLARENPDYTVLVTGHSLGAAAAAVCAADLAQRMLVESERVVLYTMGEPRTGDGIFAEGLNDRVGTAYRVVHNRDIVPHLALCCHGWFGKCKAGEVSCPYQHATEIVYANDMGPGASWLMCNGTIGEDYACDPQAVDLSVSDHTHYFEMLVGQYCATAPEDLLPFPESKAIEEARWVPYEAAMRRENDPRTFWDRAWG